MNLEGSPSPAWRVDAEIYRAEQARLHAAMQEAEAERARSWELAERCAWMRDYNRAECGVLIETLDEVLAERDALFKEVERLRAQLTARATPPTGEEGDS